MPTVLITGCDTGLGREFARQYAADGWDVIATYLDPANRLPGDGRIRHFALDVTRAEAFDGLQRAIGAEPIDLLLSNAGIGEGPRRLGEIDYDHVRRMLAVNTLGPLKLVETFMENVAAGHERRIAIVSSRMGSIGGNITGGQFGYRASKAALNALARSIALELAPRGIRLVVLHPGQVATPGGGENAPLSATESVAGMREVIRRLGIHETGQFFTHAGTPLPW